jgi:hypothetical protein
MYAAWLIIIRIFLDVMGSSSTAAAVKISNTVEGKFAIAMFKVVVPCHGIGLRILVLHN